MLVALAERRELGTGLHSRAVRELPALAANLVRLAVMADRQAGASWAQVGVGLNISADAARACYGRLRFHYNDELSFGMRRSEPLTVRRKCQLSAPQGQPPMSATMGREAWPWSRRTPGAPAAR